MISGIGGQQFVLEWKGRESIICRDAKFRIKTSPEMRYNEGLQWRKFINIVIDILCLPGTWFGNMALSSQSRHNAKLVTSD